jgi:hypothetical protein
MKKTEPISIPMNWDSHIPELLPQIADGIEHVMDFSGARGYEFDRWAAFGVDPVRPAHSIGAFIALNAVDAFVSGDESRWPVPAEIHEIETEFLGRKLAYGEEVHYAARKFVCGNQMGHLINHRGNIVEYEQASSARELYDRYSAVDYDQEALRMDWDALGIRKGLQRAVRLPGWRREKARLDDYTNRAHPRQRATVYGSLITCTTLMTYAESALVEPDSYREEFYGSAEAPQLVRDAAYAGLLLRINNSLPDREARTLLRGR